MLQIIKNKIIKPIKREENRLVTEPEIIAKVVELKVIRINEVGPSGMYAPMKIEKRLIGKKALVENCIIKYGLFRF